MEKDSWVGGVFVVLKLTGIIHWSWWWVTLPFWAASALLITVGVPMLAVAYIDASIESLRLTRLGLR